jgi:hypothetical protein
MYQTSISLRLKTKFLPFQPQLLTTLWVIIPSQFASIVFGPELHPQSALKRNMFFTRKSFHNDQLGACSWLVLLVLDWLLCLPTSSFATTPSLHIRAVNSTCQHNPEIFLGASSTLPTIRVPKRCQNNKCSNFESDWEFWNFVISMRA